METCELACKFAKVRTGAGFASDSPRVPPTRGSMSLHRSNGAAKLCVEMAIKYYPVLVAGLKKSDAADAATAGPQLDFGSDDDEEC